MEKQFTEKEKAELALVGGLATVPLKMANRPGVIVIGLPQGMYVTVAVDKKDITGENINFGFKVAVGLLTSFDALTKEEQKQLTTIADAAMKRKNAKREAEASAEKAQEAETFDSSSVGEATSGEEAQHG